MSLFFLESLNFIQLFGSMLIDEFTLETGIFTDMLLF